mmetsp:Transcript_8476/g.17067  ORF Transcript_8476/g.17067 Transcript_8476/m.17067 type:complete len:126 (-) Transcript_8476:309-686(-)
MEGQIELSERHVPPCPSSQPRRSSLKSPNASLKKMVPPRNGSHDSLSSPGDDGSDLPLTERFSPRRMTTWGDEHGHDLMITHHVYDTHYKRSFYRRHRFEICCASMVLSLAAIIAAVVLSLAGVR